MTNIREPEVGDYVAVKQPKMIVYHSTEATAQLNKIYIKKIIGIKNNIYRIDYGKKYPNNITIWWLQKSEIIDHAKTKKELRYLKETAKYNL